MHRECGPIAGQKDREVRAPRNELYAILGLSLIRLEGERKLRERVKKMIALAGSYRRLPNAGCRGFPVAVHGDSDKGCRGN